MKDLFTTDELLVNLKTNVVEINEKKRKKFKLNKKHIFGSIVFIAVLHLVFMALPMISKDFTRDLLGYQYVIAIPKDQEIDGDLTGNVIKLKDMNPSEVKVGDRILIYGLYSNDFYWEVEVLDHDNENQTIEATFDDIIRNRYTYDQIEGIYGAESNIVGVFYYTASTLRGFLMMVFLHALIIYIVYYQVFSNQSKKVKVIKK